MRAIKKLRPDDQIDVTGQSLTSSSILEIGLQV